MAPSLLADEFDAYIIVSFVNATLVLSIGETVEEVTDSGFLGTTPTLSCSQLGDDALVQVKCAHPVDHVGHLKWEWSVLRSAPPIRSALTDNCARLCRSIRTGSDTSAPTSE